MAALFIVGTTRSGTSWMMELCAAHPELRMGYEAKLPTEGAVLYEAADGDLNQPGSMAKFIAQLQTVGDEEMNSWLDDVWADDDLVERCCSAHRAEPGWGAICREIFMSSDPDAKAWGNKMLRAELAPLLLEHWPDARIIVLTRDPRAVRVSQSGMFGHSLEYSVMYWLTHAEWVHEHLEADDRVRSVRVEDLAADPLPTLQWAFEGIGIDTDIVAKMIADNPPEPARLEAWRQKIDPEEQRLVEGYCYGAMQRFGYHPELATEERPLAAWRRLRAQIREHGRELIADPGAIRRKQVLRRLVASLRSGN